MYKIATLNKISPVGLADFTDDYQITEDLNEANGILVRSQDMLTMDFSPNLMAIARAGAGVNNIPLDRCAEQGIVVFNTPGANANAVKELVVAAMLMDARNLAGALDWVGSLGDEENIAKAVEKGKGKFAGNELYGKSICIIGLGAIGVLVANACEDLGMKVTGYAPYMSVIAAHDMSNTIPFVTELDDILPKCDYVSVHVPVRDDTKGMINADFISKMKDGAVLINYSRDKLAVEDDVLAALDSGKLRKYITDFPTNKVFGHKNVFYTPHLGASTEEAEDNCAKKAVAAIRNYLESGNIENSVNMPACSLGKLTNCARICIINKNIPTMLGKITGILADLGINIENLLNKSRGNYAYTMLDIDSDIDEDKLAEALAIDGILSVRVFKK